MTEPPKKIWTPDQKVPESVRKMAFLFFLEWMKQELGEHEEGTVAEQEGAYRACIETAKMIHRVDAENEPPK